MAKLLPTSSLSSFNLMFTSTTTSIDVEATSTSATARCRSKTTQLGSRMAETGCGCSGLGAEPRLQQLGGGGQRRVGQYSAHFESNHLQHYLSFDTPSRSKDPFPHSENWVFDDLQDRILSTFLSVDFRLLDPLMTSLTRFIIRKVAF